MGEQKPVYQEMLTESLTAGSSSKSSHNTIDGSFMPRPNNFHKDMGTTRERLTHDQGLKLALRMKTNLEVVDDGFKWKKYGKKAVKSSPYPRYNGKT
ncbi:DNA-binding WRKY [Artemisia annua]|uniref:DNA-binding WRKY n=1 Tax=Artemisia annua TaxID=35608 RepID=A0A2U1MTV3_ARTAN|nr:DNA-binding WRKY [Artemisia annua]